MHRDQFTAKGPPFSGSGYALAGFSTNQDGGGFQFGVRVIAARFGIVGETSQGGIAAVCGQGRFSQFGVLGTGFNDRVGVVGVSVDNTNELFNLNIAPGSFNLGSVGGGYGTGVLGKSGSGVGVHGTSATSTAVLGASHAGFGVHGTSDTNTAVVGASHAGFGVHGISDSNTAVAGASKTGLGVHGTSNGDAVVGESQEGDGVVGRSSNGHGGRFEAGHNGAIVGQIHLVPQPMPVTNLVPAAPSVYDIGVLDLLPSQGEGGDLLVTQTDDGNCVLWMCTRSSAPPERAVWRQVLLADPGATSPASQDLTFVDWRQVIDNLATGTLAGRDVILEGPIGTGSSTDAMFRGYDTDSFVPRLPASDCLEIVGGDGHTFKVTFSAPVKDPVLMLASVGSVITFAPGTALTRVSGDSGFEVNGPAITGAIAGSPDLNGVIRLEGTFTSIAFSAVCSTPGVPDGIYLQIGGIPPTS